MAPTEERNGRGKRHSGEVAEPVSTPPEWFRCKGDLENILGIVGIVGTFLNLLVVVLVYVYTPI